MRTVIGIDIGGSTTKIVGFREDGSLMEPMSVKATDPITSAYGAFGRFTVEGGVKLEDIDKVMVTGVGSSYIGHAIYGLPCQIVPEFDCVGRGGLWLSQLREALVVSMGTGTALVHAVRGKPAEYLGGTGVGGGTLVGLSRMLLGMDNLHHVEELAAEGDLKNIDLRVADITRNSEMLGMRGDMTAANFGKVSDLASKGDIALGILNMVYETIAMCSIFAARSFGLRNIVLTGNLTTAPQAASTFATLSEMFGVRFLIPQRAQFGPVIGAALSASDAEQISVE